MISVGWTNTENFWLTNLILKNENKVVKKRFENDELDLCAPEASHRASANRLETICYPPPPVVEMQYF